MIPAARQQLRNLLETVSAERRIDAALFDGFGAILAASRPSTSHDDEAKALLAYEYAQPPPPTARLWTGATLSLGRGGGGELAEECPVKRHGGGVTTQQDYCEELGSISPSNCTQLGPLTLPEARCALLTECSLDAGMIPGVLEGGGTSLPCTSACPLGPLLAAPPSVTACNGM